MELRHRLLLRIAALAAGVLAAGPAARAELPALEALTGKGARISAAIVDLQDGRVIEQLGAAQRLAPASLTKLIVTAAALEAWPADRSFDTALLSGAPLREGVLGGELILQGASDATLDDEKLRALAARLHDAGVREVRGPLRVRTGAFPAQPCETADRCNGEDRSDRAYNALLSSIGVDFGNWCVLVRPTVVNQPAELRHCGGTVLPLPVDGQVMTAREGARATLVLERRTGAAGDRLRVAGAVPLGPATRHWRAMSDPSLGAGQLLAAMLAQTGVVLRGPVIASDDPMPPGAQTLAQVEGLPLREQLGRMMRFSNNYIADVLTLQLAA